MISGRGRGAFFLRAGSRDEVFGTTTIRFVEKHRWQKDGKYCIIIVLYCGKAKMTKRIYCRKILYYYDIILWECIDDEIVSKILESWADIWKEYIINISDFSKEYMYYKYFRCRKGNKYFFWYYGIAWRNCGENLRKLSRCFWGTHYEYFFCHHGRDDFLETILKSWAYV